MINQYSNIVWGTGLPYDYNFFLKEKYHSMTFTCEYLDIFKNIRSSAEYMILYEEENIVDLFIFEVKGNKCICYNDLICIDQNQWKFFCDNIFLKYNKIKEIILSRLYNQIQMKNQIVVGLTNDSLFDLPQCVDDYFLMMGTQTRRHIKNYRVRLNKNFPNNLFECRSGGDIEKDIVERIIDLNSQRMIAKGNIPGIDEEYKNNICQYAKNYDCVAFISINEQIIAGTICYILYDDVYLHVIAHDNSYSKFNVGQICLFELISYCINNKKKTFHFLWGVSDYKKRFLGKPYTLTSYKIYRSKSFVYLKDYGLYCSKRLLTRIKSSHYLDFIKERIKEVRRKRSKLFQ